jgi:hypothetical protein
MKQNHIPMNGRQLFYGSLHFIRKFDHRCRLFRVLAAAACREPQLLLIRNAIEPFLPSVFQAVIHRDSIDPRRERGRASESTDIPEDSNEDFLREVFGVLNGIRVSHGEPINPRFEAIYQLFECAPIPALQFSQQPLLVVHG